MPGAVVAAVSATNCMQFNNAVGNYNERPNSLSIYNYIDLYIDYSDSIFHTVLARFIFDSRRVKLVVPPGQIDDPKVWENNIVCDPFCTQFWLHRFRLDGDCMNSLIVFLDINWMAIATLNNLIDDIVSGNNIIACFSFLSCMHDPVLSFLSWFDSDRRWEDPINRRKFNEEKKRKRRLVFEVKKS